MYYGGKESSSISYKASIFDASPFSISVSGIK